MDKHLKHRINAGRVAVMNQVAFFRRQFGRVASQWKDDDTRVTFADFAISEKISAELRRSFPGDDYCSEEGNPLDEVVPLKAKFAWMLDPIDGTNNYAIGMPSCGISLALLREGVPIYGFIYDMSRDRLMEGGPEQGLLDGDSLIERAVPPFTAQSITGISTPLGAVNLRKLQPLLENHKTRAVGSGALTVGYVALGFLDGCVDYRSKVWDFAAGHALSAAAGLKFVFMGKSPFPMEEFHVSQKACPFYAGTPGFCDVLSDWLGKDPA